MWIRLLRLCIFCFTALTAPSLLWLTALLFSCFFQHLWKQTFLNSSHTRRDKLEMKKVSKDSSTITLDPSTSFLPVSQSELSRKADAPAPLWCAPARLQYCKWFQMPFNIVESIIHVMWNCALRVLQHNPILWMWFQWRCKWGFDMQILLWCLIISAYLHFKNACG